MKVLLIEDNAAASLVIERFLSDCGYDVRTASRARESVKLGIDFAPHYIVSDWNINDEVSGIEVASSITSYHPGARVLLMSGYPADDVLLQARCKGLEPLAVLQKPLDLDLLLEALESGVVPIMSSPLSTSLT